MSNQSSLSVRSALCSMGCFFEDPLRFNMKVIYRMLKNKKILYVTYDIEHDGYDEDGPESDLYNIYFVVEEDNKNVCYIFHVENWYRNTPDNAVFKYKIVLDDEIITQKRHQYFGFRKKVNEIVSEFGQCNTYEFAKIYYGIDDLSSTWDSHLEAMYKKVFHYVM